MLKNLGLTQRYKIISSLRSRLPGQLYKVEASSSSRNFVMLVLGLANGSLSIHEQQQLEQLQSFLSSYDNALSLEALSLESTQLIAVQPWSHSSTLDQSAQISIQEGRQLLYRGLELIQAAQELGIRLGGLQSESLTWDGKKLTLLPLGAIAAQLNPPSISDLAQLASSVIWAITHFSVEPGRSSQFWQAQIQLEDPELRAVLEALLTDQILEATTAIHRLQPPENKAAIATVITPTSEAGSKSLIKSESDLKPTLIPEVQPATILVSELASTTSSIPTSQTNQATDSTPVVAGVLAGCLGIAFLIALPLVIAVVGDRNSTALKTNTEQQAELERELEKTKRALEEERAKAAANQQTSTPPLSSSTPPARRSPETISSVRNWQPTCGSPRGSGTTWWPVKAEVGSLQAMKKVYCGDAYIKGSDVQIASFTSQSEAQEFASLIASETGYRVFVDSPISLD